MGWNPIRLMPALLAIFWGSCATANAAPLPPPIAPAAEGNLQCYAPDPAHKTCQSLAGYVSRPDGSIDNIATVLVSRTPLITMTTHTPVTVQAERVCGSIRVQDLEAAEFTVNGDAATAAETIAMRRRMRAAMNNFVNHEICTAYLPWDASFIARASVDGVERPSMDQTVTWVSPNEGYRVGP